MIDIVAGAGQIMNQSVTQRSKFIDYLRHLDFAALTPIEIAEFSEQSVEPYSCYAREDDRKHQQYFRTGRLVTVGFELFPTPEKPSENACKI